MLKNLKRNISISTVSFLLIPVFLVSFSVVHAAWTAPGQAFPNGDSEAPLHTGTTAQVKNGDLSVNAFSAILNSYFASKVGIGTASPTASLDVKPTVTATSDYKGMNSGFVYNGASAMTNYYAHYIAAPTGSGSITNKYALVTEASAGKVGIGTVAPAAALSVNGGVQIGDDSSTCSSGNAGTLRYHGGVTQICIASVWRDMSATAPCAALNGCPTGSVGTTCSTYSTGSVVSPNSCPSATVSTCSGGTWSPTPKAYGGCTVTVDPIYGCTNSSACNYDSNANTDNGSCAYPGGSCSASNNCGDSNSGTIQGDCSCDASAPDDRDCSNYSCGDHNCTCQDTNCGDGSSCTDTESGPQCGCAEGYYALYGNNCVPDNYCRFWDPSCDYGSPMTCPEGQHPAGGEALGCVPD